MSEATKAIKIDFSDKTLKVPKGKASKLDPTDDSFSYSAPAPAGEYDLKLTLSNKGIEARAIDPEQELSDDNVYFMANMECLIVNNEQWENGRVFPVVTTRIGRGKNLSTMADLIVRLAGPKVLKPEMTDYEVAQLFSKLMDKQPIMKKVPLDWNIYSKEDKKNVLKTMTEFPEDGKGGYKHQVDYRASTKVVENLTAQLYVVKWPIGQKPVEGGDKDEKKASKKPLPKLPEPEPTTDDDESPFGDLS